METRPSKKGFSFAPFAVHATRGVILNRGVRRRMMLGVLAAALAMLLAGSTFLREILDPHEHAARYIIFWLACGWLTITALLLALFDVLAARAENRAAKKLLEKRFTQRGGGEDV